MRAKRADGVVVPDRKILIWILNNHPGASRRPKFLDGCARGLALVTLASRRGNGLFLQPFLFRLLEIEGLSN
jgi:hypothetical protein